MPLQYNAELPIALGLPPNPEQSSRCVPVFLNLSSGVLLSDDLTLESMQNSINNVQTVFIDNADNASLFTLTFPDTGHRIRVKGNTQGFYPVMCLAQVKYTALLATVSGVVRVFFLNTQVPFAQWAQA